MKVLFEKGQMVDCDNRKMQIVGLSALILDLQGNLSGYYLGQMVNVNGLRFMVIGIEPEIMHVEIMGDYTIGEI